jgi:hypothetical protein
MNRRYHYCFTLSLVLTLGWPGARPSRAEVPKPEMKLTVRVYNYAEVPAGTLAQGEEQATRVFSRAGVKLLWADCPISRKEIEKFTACPETAGPAVLTLKILPEFMAEGFRSPRQQFGITIQSHASFVFFHRVEELAKNAGLSIPVILALVIAHELGHLVLGEGNHSATGIMSEDLRLKEFRQAEEGAQLLFTPQQAQRMRARLQEKLLAKK